MTTMARKQSTMHLARNRPLALLATLALLAILFVDAGVMLVSHPNGAGYVGLAVPSHPWRLEASAPSRTWESPSLHQGIRKAPAATVATLEGAVHSATTASIDHATRLGQDSPHRLRLISPRAPPQNYTSL